MLKTIVSAPDEGFGGADDVYSVSTCISPAFADYIPAWRHNGFWLFNRPSDMDEIIDANAAAKSDFKLFYYAVHPLQFDQETRSWSPFAPEASLETAVEPPQKSQLEGFDVVTFAAGSSPECSPLSCNGVATHLPVNAHCLFSSFEAAEAAINNGAFENSEPGPLRIFAVYSVSEC